MFKNDRHTDKPKRKSHNRQHLLLKATLLAIMVIVGGAISFVSLSPPIDDKNLITSYWAVEASSTPQVIATVTVDFQSNSDFPTLFIRATAQAHGGIPAYINAPGGILLRAEPTLETEIVGQLHDGSSVIALGQSLINAGLNSENTTRFSRVGHIFNL